MARASCPRPSAQRQQIRSPAYARATMAIRASGNGSSVGRHGFDFAPSNPTKIGRPSGQPTVASQSFTPPAFSRCVLTAVIDTLACARQTGCTQPLASGFLDRRTALRTRRARTEDLRPIKITPDFITTAEGSVLIEAGQTRVIATATVDDGVPSFLKGSGKGWVTSEYGMLPRATDQRTAARIRARQAIRPHAGNPAADRALVARRDRSESARRAHRMDRLRRDSGRWRHAHGFDHRRVCGAGAGVRAACRGGNSARRSAERFGRRDQRRDRERSSCCSISTTKKIRRRRWI